MEVLIVPRQTRSSETPRPAPEQYVIRLTGRFDRHEAEALRVEIRTLARRHHLAINDLDVRRTEATGDSI